MLSNIIHTGKERDTSENVDHEYEVLDKYSQPLSDVDLATLNPNQLLGDYELTACPAYVPVAGKGQTTDDRTRGDQDNEEYEDIVVSPN